MLRNQIEREITEAWEWAAKQHGVPNPSDRPFFSTLEEQDFDAVRSVWEAHSVGLGILEQGIEWLACLHVSLEFAADAGEIVRDERAPMAFIGACAAYATAVRRLVLSGLDSPARTVARSLIEGLRYALVTIHDPALRRAVQAPGDLVEANQLWYQHLRPARIEKLLDQVEADVGLDVESREELRAARKEESLWLGHFAHLSYVSACVTTMTPTAANPKLLKPAILGLASNASGSTLATANRAIWYFSRFGYGLLQREPRYAQLVHNPDTDVLVIVGREALSRLVLSHWMDEDEDDGREEA